MNSKQLEELEQLKKTLTSLVVSSPSKIDVRSLSRDFRENMGTSIPFLKFGYRDLNDMLRERFRDVFQFSGPPSNPVLIPIVTDAIKHIDNLVTRQRSTSASVARKGKRSSIQRPIMQISRNHIPNGRPSYREEQEYAGCRPAMFDYSIKSYRKSTDQNYNHEPPETSLPTKPQTYMPTKPTPTSLPSSSKNYTEMFNKFQSFKPTKDPPKVETWMPNKSVHQSEMSIPQSVAGASASGSSSTAKLSAGRTDSAAGRREKVRNQLRDLIQDHPDGIWSIDLQTQYRAKYMTELDYLKLGYDSVMSLCYDTNVFRISRPRPFGDWLLLDARRSEPPKPNDSMNTVNMKRNNNCEVERYNSDDALPGIDYEPSIFPADCLGYLDSIAPLDLSHIEIRNQIEVCVAEVCDPSHFWFQLQGPDCSEALDKLMDDLLVYYEDGDGKNRKLAQGAVREGQYVAALFQGYWHRAIIVQIVDKEHIKVRHIDYGTVEQIRRDSVYMLPRMYSGLNSQAIRGRLARIKPSFGNARWTLAASRLFLELIKQRTLIAYVVGIDALEQIYSLILIDTTTSEDILIRQTLVHEGLAEIIPEDDPDPEDDVMNVPYLLPTFTAIETGRALNFGDKTLIERIGFSPELFDEHVTNQPRVDISIKRKSLSKDSVKSDTKDSRNDKLNQTIHSFEPSNTLNQDSKRQFNPITHRHHYKSLSNLHFVDNLKEASKNAMNNANPSELRKNTQVNTIPKQTITEKFSSQANLSLFNSFSERDDYRITLNNTNDRDNFRITLKNTSDHDNVRIILKNTQSKNDSPTNLVDLDIDDSTYCPNTSLLDTTPPEFERITSRAPIFERVNYLGRIEVISEEDIHNTMALANLLKINQPSQKQSESKQKPPINVPLPKPLSPVKAMITSIKAEEKNPVLSENGSSTTCSSSQSQNSSSKSSKERKASIDKVEEYLNRSNQNLSPPTRPYSNPSYPPINPHFIPPVSQSIGNPRDHYPRPYPMPQQNYRPRYVNYMPMGAFPPQHYPYPAYPNMIHPNQQMMPPPQHMIPPNHQRMPPPQQMIPPNHQTMASPQHMIHPQQFMMPPQQHQMPAQQIAMPPYARLPAPVFNNTSKQGEPLMITKNMPSQKPLEKSIEPPKIKASESTANLSVEAAEFVPTRKFEMTEIELELYINLVQSNPELAAKFIAEKKKMAAEKKCEQKAQVQPKAEVPSSKPPPGFEHCKPTPRNL